MLACLKSASLKSVATIALVCSFSAPALAANKQFSSPAKQSVVSQAILTDEEGKSICAVDVSGMSELAPHGTQVAPEGFKSRINMGLRPCDKNETAAIWQHASTNYMKPKNGLLPAVAVGWGICKVSAIVSVPIGVFAQVVDGNDYHAWQFFPAYIGAAWEGWAKMPMKSLNVRANTGALIGLVCGAAAQVAVRQAIRGVVYVMENGLPEAKAPKHRTR